MLPGIFDDAMGMQLFGYVTFRVAMAGLTAFLFALWWGNIVIAWLKRHRVVEDVSKTDLTPILKPGQVSKRGTPTMGGSFLVAALLASVLLWCRLDNANVLLGLVLTAGIASVGFVDDYLKLTVKESRGLARSAKMMGLGLIALFVVGAFAYYARTNGRETLLHLYPPFFKNWSIPLGASLIGVLVFVAFEWVVVVGWANAANITDGMDGLATGCMIISGLTLAIFCYVSGRWDWTSYLAIPYVPAASEMAVMGGALVGSCLGFLWYNAFPAKVFMGDSGSLPIGALLAWMAIVAKQELVLPLIGAVFFANLGSSWLQTFWYKRSGGRRIFTCAPVHHGLERHGGIFHEGAAPWHEVTVVVRAWIVAAACAMLGLALLKVR